MPFSSPSAHAPGWDSSDPCVMLPDASEFLCDGSVTSVSLLKVTSLSAFVRALGVPGAGAGTMQGWPQKSCFTNMVRGVLNLSIPDQGAPQQEGKLSDGQMAQRHLQRVHSPSTHLSQVCSYSRFKDESTPNSLHFLLALFPSTPPLPHTGHTTLCVASWRPSPMWPLQEHCP